MSPNLLASPRFDAPTQARGSPPSTAVLVMQSLCHISGDSVTLSVTLKLLQAWWIQGEKQWKGLEIKITVTKVGEKKKELSTESLYFGDSLGETRKRRGLDGQV